MSSPQYERPGLGDEGARASVQRRADDAKADSAAQPGTEERRALAEALDRLGAVQFGEFTLKDGSTSPVYCDLRLLIGDPEVLRRAARIYASMMAGLFFDRIAAIPHAGLPLGTAIALEMDRPMIFPRRGAKAYGRGRVIEGPFRPGETAVVIDDLISSGSSKLEAIAPLEEAGLVVEDVVVLIDRRPATSRDVEAAGYRVHAAFTLRDLADDLLACGRMDRVVHNGIVGWLDSDELYRRGAREDIDA